MPAAHADQLQFDRVQRRATYSVNLFGAQAIVADRRRLKHASLLSLVLNLTSVGGLRSSPVVNTVPILTKTCFYRTCRGLCIAASAAERRRWTMVWINFDIKVVVTITK